MRPELLTELGLSEGEIKVFFAVLQTGISSLNDIHEKTGIERRNIYDILNKLIDKGLVSYTLEKGKRTYQCASPNKLAEEIEKRKARIKELEQELPEISEMFERSKPSIMAEVYRGKEGMKAIFEDMLNYKDNWFIGGNGGVEKYMPFFWEQYNKRRIEKKIFWHDLIDHDTLIGAFKTLAKAKEKLKQIQYYEYKVLPEELKSPHVIFIYGDKIANVLWFESPFAFIIKNREIVLSYSKYFQYLWNAIQDK